MKGVSVIRNDGATGLVVGEEERGFLIVEFNDGSSLVVPPDLLVPQEDNTYYLEVDTTELTKDRETSPTESLEEEQVIQVVAEELHIETERVARGVVRVHKRVETREEIVNTTLSQEKVTIDHIPVNKVLEEQNIPKIRQENGVLIIPVIEEVLVIEKRLLLREEVHISRQRTKQNIPKKVILRREVVDIERSEPDGTEII